MSEVENVDPNGEEISDLGNLVVDLANRALSCGFSAIGISVVESDNNEGFFYSNEKFGQVGAIEGFVAYSRRVDPFAQNPTSCEKTLILEEIAEMFHLYRSAIDCVVVGVWEEDGRQLAYATPPKYKFTGYGLLEEFAYKRVRSDNEEDGDSFPGSVSVS